MRRDVTITDVTLRDGLQDQLQIVETQEKARIASLLVAAGVVELEMTSFVHPQWVPQLADAEALLQSWPAPPGVRRHALVPNRRGFERALATSVECLTFVVSASSAHNRSNVNRSTEESLRDLEPLAASARKQGRAVRGAVATSFGCPFQGSVSDGEIARVVEAYLRSGIEEIVLADTIGSATRERMREVLDVVTALTGRADRIALHLHDGGSGVLDLVDVALDRSVRSFDTTIGGLGGCPFAPGAPGNLKAERLVPHLERRGLSTGVDAGSLTELALALGVALGRGTLAPDRRHAEGGTA